MRQGQDRLAPAGGAPDLPRDRNRTAHGPRIAQGVRSGVDDAAVRRGGRLRASRPETEGATLAYGACVIRFCGPGGTGELAAK